MLDHHEDVVWPRSRQAIDPQTLAPRPESLDGKTVAFLWDYLFRGDDIFPVIAEELKASYPSVNVINFDEFGTTHGEGEAELVAALGGTLRARGVDVVVSGMAC